MFILGDKWSDGYLDYACGPGQLRIKVRAWANMGPVTGVYFVRSRNLRMVWNYIGEFGIRAVLKKIFARMEESLRNRRVLAVGLGQICQTDAPQEWPDAAPVAFIAPCHPLCVERVVLPHAFVRHVKPELLDRVASPDGIRWTDQGPKQLFDEGVAGWDPQSGLPTPHEALDRILEDALRFWTEANPDEGKTLPLPDPSPTQERTAGPQPKKRTTSTTTTAVVFGLGQYAKTVLLRFMDPRIRVECVHELEPTQLGKTDKLAWFADTSPIPRPDEQYDAYFIAGYHHTHADLAIEALRRGAYAVVTKPLITNQEQLERFLAAMREHPGRTFACFPMRHNPFWTYAREDLGTAPGDPIHYYCIVYETPLPRLHWYRWPNSGSRLVSNGCHWLDHFLFMNDFQPVKHKQVTRFANGDLCVTVELQNDAAFTMTLTDHGSERIGMQQHVELRANETTIRVYNASRYFAEGPKGILRKKRIPRQQDARHMYAAVSKKVAEGAQGDPSESIERSCRLVMDLEAQLKSQYGEARRQ